MSALRTLPQVCHLLLLRRSTGRLSAVRSRTVSTVVRQHKPLTVLTHRRHFAATNLNRDDIGKRIIQLIRDFDKVTADQVTEESHFTKDLGLDSLDTVEVVMAIEEEFSIEIPDKEADAIVTVKQAVEYIASRHDAV